MEKKTKTVALIASYNRDLILRDCITCLQPQVDDIVLVGSSEWVDGTQGSGVEKKVAKDMDLIYVDHTNKILGQKWQAGLNRCRDLDPDAVLICGSDDLLSHDYINEFLIHWDKYTEDELAWWFMFGKRNWEIYDPLTEQLCFTRYTNRTDFIGAGRVIGSELLNALDWQIFPSEAVGCDLYSWNIMRKHNAGSISMNFGTVLSVKGDWAMLDSWAQIISSPELHISFINREKLEKHLTHFFPLIDFDKYRRKHV